MIIMEKSNASALVSVGACVRFGRRACSHRPMRDDHQTSLTRQRSLFDTTYLRDIIERNHLRNPEGLKELVRVLASGIGSSTNPTRIANTFQSAQGVTIKRGCVKSQTSGLFKLLTHPL